MALGTTNDGQCNEENTLNQSEKLHIDSMPTSNAMEEIHLKNGNGSSPASEDEKCDTNGEHRHLNGHADADEKSEKNDSEVLEIMQDNGFNISIVSPGMEPLSIQVSSMELVQEIHQLLMDREDTCHRTCFSLQLDGVTLDNFAELKNIEGLKEGSVIKVVEEQYTMREARIHVRHVRDLLKCMDPADAYNGIDCYSLTFLHTITKGDLVEKKKSRTDSVDCTPPEYIMPGSKERPLLPLQPGIKNAKGPPSLKVLTTSAWNPPPGPRKLHGDLMYLYVITMEDKRIHITACPKGFYINQSTEETFNPKPENPSHLCHSLIELLSQISPTFKRSFAQMQKKRTLRHPFERVATPYQIYTWCAPSLDHTLDAIRAEDTFSSKLGYEEHIPGQTRDWNEELQSTRELPRKTLPERLMRERAIFKVHSDFVTAATRGAMAVIDGNVMAINPGEDAKMQMFIWNNIFFSLGFDVRDHYKDLGGDAAAFVAPRNDLHGVRVYSAVDIEGLYTLGTVIIDYRGYRVTAQSIIPGILEREQEQSVVYGSIDFGKTVLGHAKYFELLSNAGQHLKILPHSVLNDKKEVVEICSSVECKGIIGNDGRHYILDLLRTFPPDVNFLKNIDAELSADVIKMGFPIEHKHKLSCLRQELLDAFVDDRYVMFIKYAAFHLQQITSAKKQKDEEDNKSKTNDITENNDSSETNNNSNETNGKSEESGAVNTEVAKKMLESYNDAIPTDEKQTNDSKDIVKRACAAVGSLREYEFDIRFNADVFSPGINHVENEDAPNSLKKQKKLVVDAATFLVTTQIPSYVRDCLKHTSAPMCGLTLTESLHSRGINMRYLGKVAELLANIPKLDYLYTISVQELILRAAKHIFYVYMQNTDIMNLSVAISHFLNCLLTTGPILSASIDELQKSNKRRNKKKTSKTNFQGSDNTEWLTMTQKSLWHQIKKECKSYWDFDLGCDSIEAAVDTFKFHKLGMLRAFCLKVGIQIMLREYNFESKNKSTFSEDDIVNVFPIVKHINPRASDAYNFYTTGQKKIQQGCFKEGFELISESLNLLNNVYGAMHSENAQCLRMLARLSYIMGDSQEALAIQQRAVLMSERVNGIDHPNTILEYAHLALYSFANNQVSTALKVLYRARYLALLIFGDNHPDIALLDSNISLILHAVGEYQLSLQFLEHSLALNIKYFGEKSLNVAISYHLVARTQSCMGDFRSALNSEKETYAIYKQKLGENHEKTQESSECLRHLTQQAVVLQKKMNDICSNGKITADLPPIHIQQPSMDSVLDMLNAINGILFIQISPKDIANLKNEIEKKQKEIDDIETIIEPKTVASNGIDMLPDTTVTAPITQKTEIIAS
ncbi:Clustered mitochondria protein like [Pseudolycoriella hygida]|uniref:Clustered mitochondria protein homolog n=1 Tax=Pseudolycoriella hygida TaxID=35572 RepID=A0A9Q0NE20_9DIPT|nr:Clustered mitochondria protein like [Pseudolycoriella hygida]